MCGTSYKIVFNKNVESYNVSPYKSLHPSAVALRHPFTGERNCFDNKVVDGQFHPLLFISGVDLLSQCHDLIHPGFEVVT